MRTDDSCDPLEHTRQFWSHRAGKDLTREDAREIRENLAGLAQVLLRIHRRQRAEAEARALNGAPEPVEAKLESVKPKRKAEAPGSRRRL